jgi:hypothetical protein
LQLCLETGEHCRVRVWEHHAAIGQMLAAQVQDDRENEPADLGIIMPAVDEVQHVADVILGEAAPGVQPHPQAHRFWPGDRGYGGLVGGPGLIKMSLVGNLSRL